MFHIVFGFSISSLILLWMLNTDSSTQKVEVLWVGCARQKISLGFFSFLEFAFQFQDGPAIHSDLFKNQCKTESANGMSKNVLFVLRKATPGPPSIVGTRRPKDCGMHLASLQVQSGAQSCSPSIESLSSIEKRKVQCIYIMYM